MVSHKSPKLQAVTLIFIGVLLISSFSFWKIFNFYQKSVLSFSKVPSLGESIEGMKPVKILIEEVKIDLKVIDGKIVNGVWEISDKDASYLNGSSSPGYGGNVVIYGHNRRNIFANLKNVKKGDIIDVFNQNGEKFEYEVSGILTVNPDQVEVIKSSGYEELTVYTCTGFLDSKRLVVKAKPLI